MKIKTTLTLQYAGLTAAVFFVFVIAVYYVSEHSRSNAFFRNLQSEAITKAHLFLNNQVDAKTMQSIYLNNQKFINEVEVAVYTTDFKILYHDALQNDIIKETPEMVERILKRKNISFYVDEYQAIGLVYPFEGKENVLLDRMIYEGKIKYLIHQAFPELKPEVLMGYTETSYNWCKENESNLWKAIIERKHLYTPDLMTTNKYFDNVPSIFLASDAPRNLGSWLGWQIIDKYMRETNSTPEALMQNNDSQAILTDSKYKP